VNASRLFSNKLLVNGFAFFSQGTSNMHDNKNFDVSSNLDFENPKKIHKFFWFLKV